MKNLLTILIFSLSINSIAQDLTIASGATVTVESGAFIYAEGNLTNAGTLTLSADADGYSQLKVDGSITNTGTISQSQYLANDGYTSMSSPMSGDFSTTSGDNTKLFYYDGSAFVWRTTNEAGRGYFATIGSSGFSSSSGDFSITGTPNISLSHSLSYVANTATGGSGSGWNLVGNPYTCSLDWTSMTKSDVNNAYYVWDPDTELYKYYASGAQSGTYLSASNTLNGIIPPMQAFWVQTTSSSASLSSTMADDGTLDNSTAYISKTVPDNLIVGVVALNDSSQNDALWLLDNMQAKTGFDGEFDAWKMENGTDQPNISSVFNGEELAINAFDFATTKVVPVRFNATNKDSHSISLEQVVNGVNYNVTLEDRHTKIFWDLSSKDYSFKNSGWDSYDPRFLLHLEQQQLLSTDDGDIDEDQKGFFVYQSEQFIYINQSELGLFEEYTLYGIDGRKITNGTIESQLQSIHAPYPTGIYVLLLKSQCIEEKVKINLLK
jgi:hypothetical protein